MNCERRARHRTPRGEPVIGASAPARACYGPGWWSGFGIPANWRYALTAVPMVG